MSTNIECRLVRQGGTKAEVGGTEYHFTPWTDGAHVCAVDEPEHADIFLSITEGYRLYRGEGKPLTEAKPSLANAGPTVEERFAEATSHFAASAPISAPVTLLGGDFPAVIEIDGKQWQLGEVVTRAHAASSLSNEDWNALEQDARDSLIEAELDRIDAETDTKAELVEQFTKLYGKKPHHNLGIEKLKEAIAAKQ